MIFNGTTLTALYVLEQSHQSYFCAWIIILTCIVTNSLQGIMSLVEYLFWRLQNQISTFWPCANGFKTWGSLQGKINIKFLLDSSKTLASYKNCDVVNWKEFRINKWFHRNKQKLHFGFPSQTTKNGESHKRSFKKYCFDFVDQKKMFTSWHYP